MGEVYHAHDRRLERDVAIKVSRPRAGDTAARTRFERESEGSRGAFASNILAIFDFSKEHVTGSRSPSS